MKRWLKYVKPYTAFFILGPLCMIIEVVGEAFMPKLMANVINGYNDGTLTVGSSITTALLMAGLAVIMMAGGVGGAYFGAKAAVNFAADLRQYVCAKIPKISLTCFFAWRFVPPA